MKRVVLSAIVATAAAGGVVGLQFVAQAKSVTPALLHNGWRLTPAGGVVGLPGDMPGSVVLTQDGRYALVNTCGFHTHSLDVVDLRTESVVQRVDLNRNWVGLAIARTGDVYVSGGRMPDYVRRPNERIPGATVLADSMHGPILHFRFEAGRLVPLSPIGLPGVDSDKAFVSGMLVLPDGSLVVSNIQTDTVYRITTDLQNMVKVKVGYRPYGLSLSPDRRTLAVSNWGGRSVSLVDVASFQVRATIPVGAHPNALAYGIDGRLFVCNAGSNTVSVIQGTRVVEQIRTSLRPGDLIGSTPLSLAISGNRLYVANADNNDIAVVDTSKPGRSVVRGFIPTGRYPSVVALTRDGGRLVVATAKGMRDRPNATRDQIASRTHTYVGNLLEGHLAFIPIPSSAQLAAYSRQALANRPSRTLSPPDRATLATLRRRIKHVVYVIKENRTYDQILGDAPRGNGEPRLAMFGRRVTPNEHKLASDFVLFDNLYTDGEVSQVGHQWTDAAYANDYTEKQWLLSYSGRGEVDSDARMFTSPGGYIWQHMRRHGKTTRIYGEYLQWQEGHDSAHGDVKANPEKYGCSAEFEKVFARGGRDTEKVAVFLKEMHAAEKTGKWPNFMVMALPEDHTHGVSPNTHTPRACVASNDLAVGRLIDGISHSRFWKDTAVFIIEDDAQDGPDHVDCHRTTGYLTSAYTRRGFVDSTRYTTSSMIRTMELILGVPPMTQYDTAAMPMLRAFSKAPDLKPWSAVSPQTDLEEMNPRTGMLVERTKRLDLSDIDRADEQEFNAILWEATYPGTPVPPPVRGFE